MLAFSSAVADCPSSGFFGELRLYRNGGSGSVSVQVYAAAARDGDATVIDGGFDGDGTESDLDNRDRLNNLKHIGNVYGDDATGNDFQGSGQFTWWERYFVPVILNETGTAFHSSGHSFEIEDLTTI